MTSKQKDGRHILSEVYEVGRGGDRKSKDFKDAEVAPLIQDDVLTKTAKDAEVAHSDEEKLRNEGVA